MVVATRPEGGLGKGKAPQGPGRKFGPGQGPLQEGRFVNAASASTLVSDSLAASAPEPVSEAAPFNPVAAALLGLTIAGFAILASAALGLLIAVAAYGSGVPLMSAALRPAGRPGFRQVTAVAPSPLGYPIGRPA